MQSRKTTYAGGISTPSGSILYETAYTYNLQGRLAQKFDDVDGSAGTNWARTNYDYYGDTDRVAQEHNYSVADPDSTEYLIDNNNPTGYSQVIEDKYTESEAPPTVRSSFVLGHDVIGHTAPVFGLMYLLYDGHGSTRALLDSVAAIVTKNGTINQLFAYDAYGNMTGPTAVFVTQAANALTSLLYSGEQTDASGMQYLRARYYDPRTGRFNRLDPFAGNFDDPQSLHKYLYTHADPVNGVDPSGEFIQFALAGAAYGFAAGAVAGGIYGLVDSLLAGHTVRQAAIDALAGSAIGAGLGAASGALWSVALFGSGAAQTAAIIGAVYERSIGLALGFASIGSAETTSQAVFRSGFAYAGGLIALLGLSGYAPNVTVFRAQPKPLISVDDTGHVKINRIPTRNRQNEANVVHVGFDVNRAHMWMTRGDKTELVSFNVRQEFLTWLRLVAKSEHEPGRGRELPWKVDTGYPDQYAIPPAVFERFEKAIIQGTGSISSSVD